MPTFYNGEFVNTWPQNNRECVHFYGSSGDLYINLYGYVGQFILYTDKNYIKYEQWEINVINSTYCTLLEEYLNDIYQTFDRKDEEHICGFGKDALNLLMNRIEITYHEYVGMCQITLSKLKGGHNIKSVE